MKITVRKNGERESTVREGMDAWRAVRGMFKDVTDQMLVPDKAEAYRLRHWMAETLRAGAPIWSEMDDNGQPCGNIMTMEPKPMRIVGIIKDDGTFEAAGDLSPEEKEEIERAYGKEDSA